MSDAEFREVARMTELSRFVALAFHALVFGSVVALLARARRRAVLRPELRAASWTLFVVLALLAYVLTAIPAWALDEHLIFWKTGVYSICHLTGVVGKILPLLVGLFVAAVDRPQFRWMSVLGGGILAASGTAFLLLASYRWATFQVPGANASTLLIGPLRASLLSVSTAAAIVVITGCVVGLKPKSAVPPPS